LYYCNKVKHQILQRYQQFKELKVQTLKQEYKQFLTDNFKGLAIKTPLFYNWKFALRFDLQTGETFNSERQVIDSEGNVIRHVGDTNSRNYFDEMIKRATTLFEIAFEKNDHLFLVLLEYKYKKRKIKFSNYTFRQIKNLVKTEISYSKVRQLYEPNDNFDIRNIAIIKVPLQRINYKNILTAIGNTDFPTIQPALDNFVPLTSKEIYFINIGKKLIFHMYDDRGLDIISSEIEILKPIYKMHNDWILEHNRIIIDKHFSKMI
jgi:hypothetical protein